jgi:hypothetical protein
MEMRVYLASQNRFVNLLVEADNERAANAGGWCAQITGRTHQPREQVASSGRSFFKSKDSTFFPFAAMTVSMPFRSASESSSP